MADKKEQIYCAEQIAVPYDLPSILKQYAKEIIENNPENIIAHSAKFTPHKYYLIFSRYFKELVEKR